MSISLSLDNSSPHDLLTDPRPATLESANPRVDSLWFRRVSLLVSSRFTIGLARIFDLEVLNHGTSLSNAFSILKTGGDPQRGGADTGSTASAQRLSAPYLSSENHFYVWKDTKAHLDKDGRESLEGKPKIVQLAIKGFAAIFPSTFGPALHKALSGVSQATKIRNKVMRYALVVLAGLATLIASPTIRFIYRKDELKRVFKNDPDYGGLAYHTSQRVEPSRIGLGGVINKTSRQGIKNAVRHHPLRFASGVMLMITGVALTAIGLGYFT